METELLNSGTLNGLYNGMSTSLGSNVVTTLMIDTLSIVKSANKQVWSDDLALTYTIVVTNNGTTEFTTATVTDIIDTTKVTFVEGSVTIDGTTTSDYTYTSGTLTVRLPDILPSEAHTIMFQVEKI